MLFTEQCFTILGVSETTFTIIGFVNGLLQHKTLFIFFLVRRKQDVRRGRIQLQQDYDILRTTWYIEIMPWSIYWKTKWCKIDIGIHDWYVFCYFTAKHKHSIDQFQMLRPHDTIQIHHCRTQLSDVFTLANRTHCSKRPQAPRRASRSGTGGGGGSAPRSSPHFRWILEQKVVNGPNVCMINGHLTLCDMHFEMDMYW